VGKPMTGMVYVGPEGIDTDAGLKGWVEECYEFASSLPVKKPATPRRSRK
jgi:hypothetical protein